MIHERSLPVCITFFVNGLQSTTDTTEDMQNLFFWHDAPLISQLLQNRPKAAFLLIEKKKKNLIRLVFDVIPCKPAGTSTRNINLLSRKAEVTRLRSCLPGQQKRVQPGSGRLDD